MFQWQKIEGPGPSEVGISTIDLLGCTGLKMLKLDDNKFSTLDGTEIEKLQMQIVLDADKMYRERMKSV
jgi:hypothetical protein